jgi:acetyltransferase (GNAT) family protein
VKTAFGWEPIETILAEPNIRELLVAYWTELSPIKHIPLDIDWPRVIAWERQQIFRVWTARVDGTLAGFITFLIQPHFLHRHTLFALDHGHYLAPAFRSTEHRVGARMWWTAKAALKEAGVRVAFIHDNALHPLSPFFLGIGARPFSAMWLLDLDDENHD